MKNINKIKLKKQTLNPASYYFDAIIAGNITILSKAITLLESTKIENHKIAEEIIELCLPYSGKSQRIGITGVPGVGKSTFIESFGKYLINEHHKKVAVLAIDPSSQKSGGSILGDKTRMNDLSINSNAFIRPSPSAGALGGVAKATRESIILCEAAGFNIILIETVGVGQSETNVNSMVDFFLLLMLAGAGDELQGIKRGIMEMADAILINKSDSEDSTKIKLAKQNYKNALHLFPANKSGWLPKVESCSALNNIGIEKTWEIINKHNELTHLNGWFEQNRKDQAKFWLNETISDSIKNMFYQNEKIKSLLPQIENDVVNGIISPFKAAHLLLNEFKK
ncbi:methylmalonyl Co-A mutase-associated GTPase MeaB [Vicingus serpentipes]|uniref:Methylmalonyl Co-A mutase-associated GTPase MeaB n=1 Tax=Vicingus serpentipes TaxID=1926625 RepID=A0A5C6RTW4_9FLAO|nr:methylmalonyl Co-A mutase-associated GTPase MeaB [Vicingus serpentipes]TXB65751.1 methylmalonyl Co-A mutase-associated GTPase MeaB [Vicingus serpentipes]